MTNSEMIERLKEFRAMVKALSVCTNIPDEAVKGDMIPDIEALSHAIELLEAEEKGNKGCQYCLDGIDIIKMKFPNTHECGGTWWKESVRTPKYCPMCGRKLPESAEAALSP